MASPNPSNILRVPGVVTFKGSAIGNVRGVHFKPQMKTFPVHAEEFGTTVEAIYSGESGICGFVARDFDAALVAAVFPGGSMQHDPTSFRAGTPLSDNVGQLQLVPRDAGQPGLTIYQALPLVELAAEINFSLNAEVGFACFFQAIPDSGGGKAWDIT